MDLQLSGRRALVTGSSGIGAAVAWMLAEEGARVLMLASPRSGFVTGANYRVDGGQVRGLN